MKAASLKKQWGKFSSPQHAALTDPEKKLLLDEKSLFYEFFDSETIDCSQIDIVLFNKTMNGMKKPMTSGKVGEILNCLLGKTRVKSIPTAKNISDAMRFGNSFGLVAVKVGCSESNKNELIGDFLKDPTLNVWIRSLTKYFFISTCVDCDSLLVLDLLGVLSLDDLIGKVHAKRKGGRQMKVNSIQTHISRTKSHRNRIDMLVEFMKKNNCSALLGIFSYQILRSYKGRYHTGVIHSFAHDSKGSINGVVIWYPMCNDETDSSNGRCEEVISLQDLAHGIIDSDESNSFHPYLLNRNDAIGAEARDDPFAVYCTCKLKAKIKTSGTNKNGNKGRLFYCCAKDQNNPTNCKFFRWKSGS